VQRCRIHTFLEWNPNGLSLLFLSGAGIMHLSWRLLG
jgi:hypothetical protein